MPGFFAKKLSDYSNHYIDWTKVTELTSTGRYKCSKEELIFKGGLIVFTAATFVAGAYIADEDSSVYNKTKSSLMAGFVGFLVSHIIVKWPIIQKRYFQQKECARLSALIFANIEMRALDDPSCRQKLRNLTLNILQLSLSDNQHARASQTWGRRRALLTSLLSYLNQEGIDEEFYVNTPVEDLIKDLRENPEPCPCGVEYKQSAVW